MPKSRAAVIKVSRSTRNRTTFYYAKTVPRPASAQRVNLLGRRGYIQDYPARLYTLVDLAKLWDEITPAITRGWYRKNLLPPPVVYGSSPSGARVPYWLRSQVVAIRRVLDKHWLAGHYRYRLDHTVTYESLYKYSENARLRYLANMAKSRNGIRRYGIQWIDDPWHGRVPVDPKNQRVTRWDRHAELTLED